MNTNDDTGKDTGDAEPELIWMIGCCALFRRSKPLVTTIVAIATPTASRKGQLNVLKSISRRVKTSIAPRQNGCFALVGWEGAMPTPADCPPPCCRICPSSSRTYGRLFGDIVTSSGLIHS